MLTTPIWASVPAADGLATEVPPSDSEVPAAVSAIRDGSKKAMAMARRPGKGANGSRGSSFSAQIGVNSTVDPRADEAARLSVRSLRLCTTEG